MKTLRFDEQFPESWCLTLQRLVSGAQVLSDQRWPPFQLSLNAPNSQGGVFRTDNRYFILSLLMSTILSIPSLLTSAGYLFKMTQPFVLIKHTWLLWTRISRDTVLVNSCHKYSSGMTHRPQFFDLKIVRSTSTPTTFGEKNYFQTNEDTWLTAFTLRFPEFQSWTWTMHMIRWTEFRIHEVYSTISTALVTWNLFLNTGNIFSQLQK